MNEAKIWVTNEAKLWVTNEAKLYVTNEAKLLAIYPFVDRTFALAAPIPFSSSLFRGDPSTDIDVRQSPLGVKTHDFKN